MPHHLHLKRVEDYRKVVGSEIVEEIYRYAQKLQGEHIVMVNSTPSGGGVAEILNSLVLLLNSVGVKTGWRILKGPDSFFQITKGFHNGLQGGKILLNSRKKGLYEQVNFNNAQMNHLDHHDLVVVHDPQPLALINYYKKRIPWIWRMHIDLSKPNQELFRYLKQYIEKYDMVIVSHPSYIQKDLDVRQMVIAPSIDPLNDKNCFMEKEKVERVLRRRGVKTDKPIIAQISRFDTWKDPLGVIEVFYEVKKRIDCRLVLMGNMAADDPEGPIIYREVMKRVNGNPDITVLVNVADNDRTVNALQRVAKVVLQKSLKEGFALTVAEALWKETPVVGTRVGGIPLQVIHKKTGYLIRNNKEAIKACLALLKNEKHRKQLGRQGKEHVRKNFLITRHVLDYLKLFDYFLSIQHRFNVDKKNPW